MLVAQHSSSFHVGIGVTDQLIEKAEEFLGTKFPPSLRFYLKEWGHMSVGPLEYYGMIGNDEFGASTVPDGVWFTANERSLVSVPKEFFVLLSNEGDEFHCIDLRTEEVKVWDVAYKEVLSTKAPDLFEYIMVESDDFL
ncbi:MAG: SMI1/KNR4 family protein [Hyphomonadaceae bacterium]|nr:SMI1/KNR4 family protein [Hyphomonadaceae bacterium]